MIPALACGILEFALIEPVRSSTIMTSSGSPPQGEHAWAWALSVIVSKPSSFSRYVGTLAVSSTVTVLGCPRVQLNPAWVWQSTSTLSLTSEDGTPGIGFSPPAWEP